MKFIDNNVKFLAILLFAVTTFMACSGEPDPVLGCTDPDSLNFNREADTDDGTCSYLRDKVVGTWEASLWKVEGTDLAREGWELEYEFEANGDFEYTFDAPDITPVKNTGEWEFKNDELILDYDAKGINWILINIFYDRDSQQRERFETKFNSTYTELELETLLDGFSVDIILEKE